MIAAIAGAGAVAAPALGSAGQLASFGDSGTGPGRITSQAPGIAVAPSGRIYIADLKDNRVEAFTNDGSPDGGWAVDEPQAVAVEATGDVLVAEEDGVRRYAPDGTALAMLAQSDPGPLHDPSGVAVGPDGTAWVVSRRDDDEHGHFGDDDDDDLGEVTAVAGPLAGSRYGGFNRPVAVAVEGDGTLLVADRDDGGRVHAIEPDGTPGPSWAVRDVAGIASAADGSVVTVDGSGNDVQRFGADGGALGSAGSGVNVPRGVATDCRGRVYVVDNSTRRVHVFGDPGPAPPCLAAPTPAPSPPAPRAAAPAPEEPGPVLGVRGRVTPLSGDVFVGINGQTHRLEHPELLPVGGTVDTTNGTALLEFETAADDRATYGRFESGEFYDGAFTIHQTKADSLVELDLADPPNAPGAARRSGAARASVALKKRLLWAHVHGRFRTVGKNAAATVRGTRWVTSERETGTYVHVSEGIVSVLDFATNKTVLVHAGESYLAKPVCESRRNFRIHLLTPLGTSVTRAIVRVRGKEIAVRRGARLTAPVDLRGEPEGTVTVAITVRTVAGLTLTGTRSYRTCSSDPVPPHKPPRL